MVNSADCVVCRRPMQTNGYDTAATKLCFRWDVTLRQPSDCLVPWYDIDPDRITLPTSWVEDLGIDSLDRADLISALEEQFGTRITNEGIWELDLVADLVRLLATRVRR